MPFLFNTPPFNVYEQMALDETLVRAYPGEYLVRFYHWTDCPALTFGYAQFVREVRSQAVSRGFTGALCRRPTGGGVVYHQTDLTFSLIFPSRQRPLEIYKNLHGSIHAALTLSGLSARVFDAHLAPGAYAPSQNHQASTCFTNPVENDLLAANGQKMLGGAIRRFGDTVLYQGSLQMPDARQNPAYKQALIRAVRGFWNVDLKIEHVPPPCIQAARQLAAAQYQSAAWTEKF